MATGVTLRLRAVRPSVAALRTWTPTEWAKHHGYERAGEPNAVPRRLRRNNKHTRRLSHMSECGWQDE